MRHVLLCDLRDDPAQIAAYEAHHRAVWPEVLAQLRQHGVRAMDIYRLGTRLTMVMETDDAVFDAQALARAQASDPRVRAWETLMSTMQAPTPWHPEGVKWAPATRVFALGQQP